MRPARSPNDEAEMTRTEEKLYEAREEIERLRAALARYGLHTWDCAWNDSRGEKPCNCGWDAYQQQADVGPYSAHSSETHMGHSNDCKICNPDKR